MNIFPENIEEEIHRIGISIKDHPLSNLALWNDYQNRVKNEIHNFASDLFITQNYPDSWYERCAKFVSTIPDHKDFLRFKTEDVKFGAKSVSTSTLGDVTRAWLETCIEIDFLKRHMPIEIKRAVDIGAGYGRLAVGMNRAFPKCDIACVDAVPVSTFICKNYIKFTGNLSRTITLNELDQENDIDLAINVHSWNECSRDQVIKWIDECVRMNSKFLFAVSHDSSWYTWDRNGLPFLPLIEKYFEPIACERLGLEQDESGNPRCPHTLWKNRSTAKITSLCANGEICRDIIIRGNGRRAILTVADDAVWDIASGFIENKKEYAKKFGYDLVIGRGRVDTVHRNYDRLYMFRDYFDQYDFMAYVDLDVVLTNFKIDIENLLPHTASVGGNRDGHAENPDIGCGVILMRLNQQARQILQDVLIRIEQAPLSERNKHPYEEGFMIQTMKACNRVGFHLFQHGELHAFVEDGGYRYWRPWKKGDFGAHIAGPRPWSERVKILQKYLNLVIH